MTTFATASTTDFRSKLTEWKEMTEDNLHTDVLFDIAMFFEADSQFVNYFFSLALKNSLTMAECNERYEKREEMMASIKAHHGSMIFGLVQKVF